MSPATAAARAARRAGGRRSSFAAGEAVPGPRPAATVRRTRRDAARWRPGPGRTSAWRERTAAAFGGGRHPPRRGAHRRVPGRAWRRGRGRAGAGGAPEAGGAGPEAGVLGVASSVRESSTLHETRIAA
ncbi:hypothetical protein D7294_25170 [Streptomyces hoynatensis]|uniref:Uncharacterized protein n=1 Tax=Streptomyces hoynatensis TaxID=1141874 RepID=A0A3A9YQ69_9ACTN|nr:hypothetical protein D7294_25170 [Streptomyces hoynatensis]